MKENEMKKIADVIWEVLKKSKSALNPKTSQPSKAKVDIDNSLLAKNQDEIKDILKDFQLYTSLVI